MATNAQIAANRMNARKSTGPRTVEGKQRSARNALKQGLFSRNIVVDENETSELEELAGNIRKLLQPQGTIEELLVDDVIANWFRLARCAKIEAGLFRAYATYEGKRCGLGTAFAQAAQLDCFGKLTRYERHLEKILASSWQRLYSARRPSSGPIGSNEPLMVGISSSASRPKGVDERTERTDVAEPRVQLAVPVVSQTPSPHKASAAGEPIRRDWRVTVIRIIEALWRSMTFSSKKKNA